MSTSQIAMANTRYRLAAEHASKKDVLEIACGSGFGIDFLSHAARRVVGGDITEANVIAARQRTRLPVARLDAQCLPCKDGSFDVAVFYEGLYYLREPEASLLECRRVLRPRGTLLICTPNKERPGFHPSPYSTRYHTAGELNAILQSAGFDPTIYGAFHVGQSGPREKAFLIAAAAAVKLHIVPRTLKGRARVKRLLHGKLPTFQGVDGVTGVEPLHALDAGRPNRDFMNLYAVARRVD